MFCHRTNFSYDWILIKMWVVRHNLCRKSGHLTRQTSDRLHQPNIMHGLQGLCATDKTSSEQSLHAYATWGVETFVPHLIIQPPNNQKTVNQSIQRMATSRPNQNLVVYQTYYTSSNISYNLLTSAVWKSAKNKIPPWDKADVRCRCFPTAPATSCP